MQRVRSVRGSFARSHRRPIVSTHTACVLLAWFQTIMKSPYTWVEMCGCAFASKALSSTWVDWLERCVVEMRPTVVLSQVRSSKFKSKVALYLRVASKIDIASHVCSNLNYLYTKLILPPGRKRRMQYKTIFPWSTPRRRILYHSASDTSNWNAI